MNDLIVLVPFAAAIAAIFYAVCQSARLPPRSRLGGFGIRRIVEVR